eukprot:1335372-Prymnesium_polylepis.1
MARRVVARAVAALVKCSVAMLKRTAVSWSAAAACTCGWSGFHAKGDHKHNTEVAIAMAASPTARAAVRLRRDSRHRVPRPGYCSPKLESSSNSSSAWQSCFPSTAALL